MGVDYDKLHGRYKDDASPSVEGQIRWLQKQNFTANQIEVAMMSLYDDIYNETPPILYELDGEKRYLRHSDKSPGRKWASRQIKGGDELDQSLIEIAKRIRTKELEDIKKNMQDFVSGLKKSWKNEVLSRVPWYKRIFGIKRILRDD